MTGPVFYLGTHRPGWLWDGRVSFPLFVSHRTLAGYRTLRPATCPGWALDSGGFTELSTFGRWQTTPAEYVEAVARYDREIGGLEWAAPQDWMCEPDIIHGGGPHGYPGTHLSVDEHQARTVENFVTCRDLWPSFSDSECPFMPPLQGWEDVDEYLRCAARYEAAGVVLEDYPVVGLGSMCRRTSPRELAVVGDLVRELTPWLALHGFGVKTQALAAYGYRLTSADSMAWSFDARRAAPLPGHEAMHKSCSGCLEYAVRWRDKTLASFETAQARGRQDDLFNPDPEGCELCGSVICLSQPAGGPVLDLADVTPREMAA